MPLEFAFPRGSNFPSIEETFNRLKSSTELNRKYDYLSKLYRFILTHPDTFEHKLDDLSPYELHQIIYILFKGDIIS